ncbi:MAG: hypothetical protein HY819_04700 [Acidobacteria bacterium]|nr:hypothetical protein [Acidobacteriota bacterium]
MQEKPFLAFKYFNINKKFQGFALITLIILSIIATVSNVKASTSFSLASNNVTKANNLLNSEESRSVVLEVSNATTSVSKGQKASYTINIDRTNFNSAVELGLTQLSETPTPGISFAYSKSSTTEDSVTLNIFTNEQTPLGTYSFVATGKASDLTINDSNRFTLVVGQDQQDFSLALSPNPLTVSAGSTANFTVNSTNKPIDSISLSVSGLPLNTTSSFSDKIKLSTVLSIVTSSNTPAGSYTVTVTGVSGNVTRRVSATLVVQNIPTTVALQVSQPTVSIGQGQSANYLVSINRSNFTGPVELGLAAISNASIPGLNFGFSQNPTTANSTSLVISTTSATPTGTYTFAVTGKASGITIANSNTITLAVTSPSQDFSLSLSPTSSTIKPGATVILTLNRNNLGGSNGNISLTISGLPTGATSSFQTGNIFPLPIQIATDANTPLGTYNITVTGTRGGFTRTASANLIVQETAVVRSVRLQISQQTLTVTQGQIANYSVGINRVNVISPVTLGLTMLNNNSIPGLGVTYSQNPTTANNVGLNLATSSSTPVGTYNFVLTGRTAGVTIPDSNTFTLVVKAATVQQPDFSLSLSPSILTIKSGETASFTIIRTDSNGFSSNISVNVTGIPSNSINGLPTSFSFPVSLPIITSTDTPVGTYTITVSGVGGGLTRTASATLRVDPSPVPKSVSLQANQTLATIVQGQSTNYPISINRTNFSEPVELGLKTLSGTTIPGLTFGYSQNPTTGNSVNLNIATTNTIPVGTYSFVITGKASGVAIADSNVINLVVNSNIQPDFTLSLAPNSLTIRPGETANYTLNRSNVGGFSDNVALSFSGLPSGASSNVTSISGASLSLPLLTSNNTPIGTYAVTITGISGNLIRTTSATLIVEPVKPMISSANYVKPLLTINGSNFANDARVFVNGKDVTSFIRTLSASLIDVKGNKKKLGLKTGSNQIKLISNGIEANAVLMSTFANEALVFLGEEIININPDDYYSKRTPKTFDSVDEDVNSQTPAQEEMLGVRED